MGSTGSWEASVSLIKKTSLKQNKANTIEEIAKFVNKHKDMMYSYTNINDCKKDDILLGVDLYDEDGDEIGTVDLSEIGLEGNINAKEFFTNKVYENHEEFDVEYSEPSDWVLRVAARNVDKVLKNLDLQLIEKNIHDWNFNDPNYLNDEMGLCSCHDYIYCHNDNSSSDEFRITQKFIDGLSVGDVIRLDGNGDGEHC